MPIKLFFVVVFFFFYEDIIPKYLSEIAAINLSLTLLIGVDTL